jgi:hypothetical protein
MYDWHKSFIFHQLLIDTTFSGPYLTDGKNVELNINYIYMYINTHLDIKNSSGFSLQNSVRTNSAKHSRPLQQLVTVNWDENPSPTNSLQFPFFSCPPSLRSPVQFVRCGCFCVHSDKSVEDE